MFHHPKWTSAKKLKRCSRTPASIREYSHIANTSTCIWEKFTQGNATISFFAGSVKKNKKQLYLLSMDCFITACSMHCSDGLYAPFNPQGWLLPFHCYLALVYHNFGIMTLTVPFGSLRTLRATCSLLVLDEWWQWLLPWVNSVNCCHLEQQ